MGAIPGSHTKLGTVIPGTPSISKGTSVPAGAPTFGFDPNTVTGMAAWYRASDLAGTDGTAIASWANTAAGGDLPAMTQGTAGQRPLLKLSVIGGKSTVLGDGVDDNLVSTVKPAAGAVTFYLAFKFASIPASGTGARVFGQVDAGNGTGFLSALNAVGGYQPYTIGAEIGGSAVASSGIADALDTNAHVMRIAYNGGTNTAPASYAVNLDGVEKTVVASGAAANDSTSASALFAVVFAGAFQGSAANVHIAEFISYHAAIGTTDDASLLAYLSGRYSGGGSAGPPFTDASNALIWDSAPRTSPVWALIPIPIMDTFGSQRGTMTSTTLTVVMRAPSGDVPDLRIFKNGVYFGNITASLLDGTNCVATLSGFNVGDAVQIWQDYINLSVPANALYGTAAIRVYGATLTAQSAPSRRLVEVCDSIDVGSGLGNPATQSAAALVRASYSGSTTVWGYGGRSMLNGEEPSAASVAAGVSTRLGSATTQRVLWRLGFNDWNFSYGTLAQVTTYMNTFVSTLHGTNPSATIVIAGPLLAHSEGNNNTAVVPWNIPGLRTVYAAIAAANPTFVTYDDLSGVGLVNNSTYYQVDLVHPNATGAALLGAYELTMAI